MCAVNGDALTAIQKINSGITAARSMGFTLGTPRWLSYLAISYANLNQFDEAWYCIGDAIGTIEATKERWFEAESNRIAGEIACKSPDPDTAKSASVLRARTRGRPPTTSQILGTPLRHEPRPPLARPGQDQASARTVGSSLRVVYGGFRHARSERGEGVAGRVGFLGAAISEVGDAHE
jgi:hypothetical protein